MSDERRPTEEQLSQLFQALRADDDPDPAFADAMFAQLERMTVPELRSTRPWMLLAGAVLVASLATGAAFGSGVLRLPWLVAEASATPEPHPSATGTVAPSDTPSQEPMATPTPSVPPSVMVGTVVTITATDLNLRTEPGLEGDLIGGLAGDGTRAFVVAGPNVSDGYVWYQLAGLGIPPQSGCLVPPTDALDECPNWFGWVAGGNDGGELWLGSVSLDCPTSPMNIDDLAPGRGDIERLACDPGGTITVRGWWPSAPDGMGGTCPAHESGWLYCQHTNPNTIWVGEGDTDGGIGLQVSVNPAGSASMPERGQWVEIIGHFDDPAAEGCDEAAAMESHGLVGDHAVLGCRAELVVDSARPVSGPF